VDNLSGKAVGLAQLRDRRRGVVLQRWLHVVIDGRGTNADSQVDCAGTLRQLQRARGTMASPGGLRPVKRGLGAGTIGGGSRGVWKRDVSRAVGLGASLTDQRLLVDGGGLPGWGFSPASQGAQHELIKRINDEFDLAGCSSLAGFDHEDYEESY